jgi:hypothetical protein
MALAIGHGLPWRFDRFIDRIAVMTGPASAPFRMFERNIPGHVALMAATAKCFVWAAGVPLVAALAGGVIAHLRQKRIWRLVAMLTPIVTYYATFLAVILYVYDRFLIGSLPIAAAIGGVFLARIQQTRLGRFPIGFVVASTIVCAGLLNALAINVVFHRDPRYAASAWLQENVACGTSVGVTFTARYTPRLDCFDVWEVFPGRVDSMARWPRYLVLNEAFAQRFSVTPSGAPFLRRLYAGDLGYQRVSRTEVNPPRWAPLYWEGRFWNRREDPETTTDKPLHAIEVWECSRPGPCGRSE